jgi:hypothetical protein
MQHGGVDLQIKIERSCRYIEEAVAGRRKGMVFQVCGWGEVLTHLIVNTLTYT